MAAVLQAYRFALDPTPRQQGALASAVGGARFAYNWGLALVKQRLDQRATGSDVRVPWTLPELRREWNRAKPEAAPWWAENSKEAYSSGLDALARALASWAASRNGGRAGPRVRFPRFKRKGRGGQGCRFTTGAIRVEADRHHVVLPRLGRIKTHESTRKLARRLEQGTARVLAATICHSGGRWFCSFACEVQRAQRTPRQPASVVGVDVGVRHLAVVSTGQVIDNPAPLKANLRKLRRHARQLARQQGPRTPGGARRVPSASWLRTKARLAKTHARIANLRRNALHRLTSDLARTDGTVVVERLHVAGMVKNRRLARAIADSGMGQVRRLLGYKCPWNGGRLVEADLFFPSSKTCSGCGTVKAKLSLAERTFECAACGLRQDRDLNAARNLAALVEAVEVVDDGNRVVVVAGSGPETENARGGDARPGIAGRSPQKREASGPSSDGREAGTVGPQGSAA